MSDSIVLTSHVARDLEQSAGLFKTDKAVIWEYVVNGLQYPDPGVSPIVRVTLDSKAKEIVIQDNGRGMDAADLANFFIMHGESLDRKSRQDWARQLWDREVSCLWYWRLFEDNHDKKW